MRKLLTVAIPVYNMEHFLPECVDSLLACPSAEYTELLVIDDGSTDRSGRIADRYAKRYPGIVKAIHKENGGHGSAINIGIALATGQYFRVVDSDDAVEPTAYEEFLKKLEFLDKQHCDLIATPFACVPYCRTVAYKGETGHGKKAGSRQHALKKRGIEGASRLPKDELLPFSDVADKLHVRMHEWTIRTAILKEQNIRLLEQSFYVDMQYILFPVPWIKTVCILDEVVYLYRLGNEAQSVSAANMQKNRRQHLAVMRSLMEFYGTRKTARDDKRVLSYLARGIAKMEANQVQTIISLPIGKAAKQELVECEQEIRETCPAAYRANQKKSIWLLRKSRYVLYSAAAVAWRVSRKIGK